MQLDETPAVVTAGLGLFVDALAAQAAEATPVLWRPPVPGTEEALATVLADPRMPDANADAVRRLTTSRPRLVGIERAGDALGLERGEFLHAGPPIDWADAAARCVARCWARSSTRAWPTRWRPPKRSRRR